MYRAAYLSMPLHPTYQSELRDRTSSERAAWVDALATHADLHTGWRPAAPLQHLCTGADDHTVPASISIAAATVWDVPLITIPGRGHTDGIAQCMLVALGNLTARSHAFHPDGSTNRSITQPATRLEVMEADMSTALFAWGRIDVATYCFAACVVLWLVATLLRLGWRRRCASSKSSSRTAAASTPATKCFSPGLWLSRSLLGCPCSLTILILLAILLPTLLQLYLTFERLLAGGELFDLEIASLRTVTGTLTDRQDAFTLLSVPIDGTLSSLATSPPSSPPPLYLADSLVRPHQHAASRSIIQLQAGGR